MIKDTCLGPVTRLTRDFSRNAAVRRDRFDVAAGGLVGCNLDISEFPGLSVDCY